MEGSGCPGKALKELDPGTSQYGGEGKLRGLLGFGARLGWGEGLSKALWARAATAEVVASATLSLQRGVSSQLPGCFALILLGCSPH